MKMFEMLSSGEIVMLPDLGSRVGVCLYLPWDRQLIGRVKYRNEIWQLYNHRKVENEVFLYDKLDLNISSGGHSFFVAASDVVRLRDALLGQLDCPGSHEVVMTCLRTILPFHRRLLYDRICNDERLFLLELLSDEHLATAYWGLRYAFAFNDSLMLNRIKSFIKKAYYSFKCVDSVKMWVTPTSFPYEVAMRNLLEIPLETDGFTDMTSINGIFKYNNGFLVRYEGQAPFGRNNLSAWFYFPKELWDSLIRRMRPVEAVVSAWGYLDCLEAKSQMLRYGNVIGLSNIFCADMQ